MNRGAGGGLGGLFAGLLRGRLGFGGGAVRGDIAVFGKHPAFGADHLESGLGRGVDACRGFKQRLYNRAIRELIPRWSKTPAERLLPELDHVILAREPDGSVILGFLKSVGDAVGRVEYPLVVLCRVRPGWWSAVQGSWGALSAMQGKVVSAPSFDEVRSSLDAAQMELDTKLASLGAPGSWPELGESTLRGAGLSPTGQPSGHARVRVGPGAVLDSMGAWCAAASSGRRGRALVAVDARGRWIDVVNGEYGSNELACLRLNERAFGVQGVRGA